MLYSLIENLPKFPIRRTKKQKSPRVNVKQYLNKPAKEIVGDSWHEKLKLTDEEMEICIFKTPLCKSKKPPGKDDIKFYQQLADIENKKRCAIYNFARQKDSDEKSKEGAGSDKILKEEEAKGCHSRVKPYDFGSPYHLLRTIRNLFTHPSKCNGDIKTITEKIGIWKFIDPRFPTFFLHIWNITMKGPFPEIKELRDQYRSHEVGRNQTALQHEDQSPSPSNGPLLPEHRMKTKLRLPLLSRNQNIETHTPPSVRDQAPISSLDEETVDLSDLFGETEPSSGHTVANLNLRC